MLNIFFGKLISWACYKFIIRINIIRSNISALYMRINRPNRYSEHIRNLLRSIHIIRDYTLIFWKNSIPFCRNILKFSVTFFAKTYKIFKNISIAVILKCFKWFFVMNIENFIALSTVFTNAVCLAQSKIALGSPIYAIVIFSSIICWISFPRISLGIFNSLTFFRTIYPFSHRWIIKKYLSAYFAYFRNHCIFVIWIIFSRHHSREINSPAFSRTSFATMHATGFNNYRLSTYRTD